MFEVDHPATQAWKRARIEDLGLPVKDGHVFAPIDFETETLSTGLDGAGFDWSKPSFFSWLGVTLYLSIEAIQAILNTVAGCEPGSGIVFSYDVSDSFLDETAREVRDAESNLVALAGEPYTTRLSPPEADALVERCGLEVAEHLTRDAIHERYFAGRDDGLCPSAAERLIAARVPG